MRSRIDGELKAFPRTLNITIGKNPLIASGLKVNVPLEPDDGKMYVFSIQGFGLFGLTWHIRKLYRGTFQHHRNNQLLFPTAVEFLECPEAPRVEFDGDAHGLLPCQIRVVRTAIRLIRPALECRAPSPT
jgi:diacylglycerol kinase family enzyme